MATSKSLEILEDSLDSSEILHLAEYESLKNRLLLKESSYARDARIASVNRCIDNILKKVPITKGDTWQRQSDPEWKPSVSEIFGVKNGI